MKYQAPYDATDANASYRDRNTPGSIRGSVPPGKAIEDPQRELVDVILKSGQVPTESVLQVALAIQSQRMNRAVVGGTANAVVATIDPVPASWAAMINVPIYVRLIETNTALATLAIAGIAGGVKTISMPGGLSPVPPGVLRKGAVAILMYNGATVEYLNAPLPGESKFYIHQANGNDLNPGTVDLPLRSLQEALRRTSPGGTAYVGLLANYNHDEITGLKGRSVNLQGFATDGVTNQLRTFSFLGNPKLAALQDAEFRATQNYPNNTSAIVLNAGSSWQSNSITYTRNIAADPVQINSAHFIADGLASLDMVGCALNSPASDVNTVWFASILSKFFLSFRTLTVSGQTTGKIYTEQLGGAPLAAGVNPNTVWGFSSNVTSS